MLPNSNPRQNFDIANWPLYLAFYRMTGLAACIVISLNLIMKHLENSIDLQAIFAIALLFIRIISNYIFILKKKGLFPIRTSLAPSFVLTLPPRQRDNPQNFKSENYSRPVIQSLARYHLPQSPPSKTRGPQFTATFTKPTSSSRELHK